MTANRLGSLESPLMTGSEWDLHNAQPGGFRDWPNEELVRFVGGRRFGAVIEAGCGGGGNLWFLREHADMVIGWDFSQSSVSRAMGLMRMRSASTALAAPASSVHASFGVAVVDLTRLPLPAEDGSIDLVVDCMTSQHLPEASHVPLYAEYFRMLRPGGFLWLYHLNARSLPWLGQLFPTVTASAPRHDSLLRMVGQAGLSVADDRMLVRHYPKPVGASRPEAHYSVIAAVRESR